MSSCFSFVLTPEVHKCFQELWHQQKTKSSQKVSIHKRIVRVTFEVTLPSNVILTKFSENITSKTIKSKNKEACKYTLLYSYLSSVHSVSTVATQASTHDQNFSHAILMSHEASACRLVNMSLDEKVDLQGWELLSDTRVIYFSGALPGPRKPKAPELFCPRPSQVSPLI